ncbi:hypothetical protein B0T24DRAFT_249523 [Lasiosphaeria ovina]|uniref:LysM domain-containing protein n=1 Tax=Lasiosphaeria ovina TaxID=92902 RepID=A0AAE0KBQ4_9PEZI|nr:hypothetical protein B0T24DRAFT_249523 [Lasiosphaeria ovina]
MRAIGWQLLTLLSWLQHGLAQDDTVTYTDKSSGIVFNTWPNTYMTFGMALPSNALTADATEFIGIITCSSPTQGTGWCGISMGGGMNSNLLLLAYPQQGQILTSFRWATDYKPPTVYTGDAKLTQISSTINSTHYSLIFRCQNCLKWKQGQESGAAPTSEGYLVLGWCHATTSPTNGACPNSLSVRQHGNQGIFPARFNSAVANRAYTSWASKATATVTGSCGGSGVPAPTATTVKAPSPTTAKAPSPTTAKSPSPTTAKSPSPTSSCAKSYTVKSGDYCYLIATNNGITLDQLKSYNPGLNCDPLRIGAVVCVRRS